MLAMKIHQMFNINYCSVLLNYCYNIALFPQDNLYFLHSLFLVINNVHGVYFTLNIPVINQWQNYALVANIYCKYKCEKNMLNEIFIYY